MKISQSINHISDVDVHEMSEGVFKESGTMIAVAIIKIKKEDVLENKVIDPTILEQPSFL